MKIWVITADGCARPLHIASTPEKAQAFAREYIHSNMDERFDLAVWPMEMDGNLDANHMEWLTDRAPDACMRICECGTSLPLWEMVEMVTSATGTDWFCSACAAKRTKLETDAYDGLLDRFTGEPCSVCGCDEFTAVVHMGRILFGCAGDDCVMMILANAAATDPGKRRRCVVCGKNLESSEIVECRDHDGLLCRECFDSAAEREREMEKALGHLPED